ENVMLRRDGIVKVLDFGLAKFPDKTPIDSESETLMHARTRVGVVMGTVAYMSPEQARGQSVDPRTDVFSLGSVFYEMLTRRQPFTGETVNHTIVAILEKEPLPLIQLVKSVPTELERIIRKALIKNANGRYQTASDLLVDLTQLQRRMQLEIGP